MFCSLLTKAYAGEMSCNQLPLSDSATYVYAQQDLRIRHFSFVSWRQLV